MSEHMVITDLIHSNAILPTLRATTKKAVLMEMSDKAAQISGLLSHEILDAVLLREGLDSTGIGDGIAIPHGKVARCDQIVGVFAKLEKPIPFDAIDAEPVDMLFMLIASEAAGADHLKALARVARMFRDNAVRGQLRATREAASLFAILTRSSPTSHAPN